uniref:CUB domain-containing protein n=2 Tax=Clastoptera arizonana TaxID=38151 RepID=A0A1B6E6U2_9HEMI
MVILSNKILKMTSSNSVCIVFISSVIYWSYSINVIKELHFNGSQSRTIYMPKVETEHSINNKMMDKELIIKQNHTSKYERFKIKEIKPFKIKRIKIPNNIMTRHSLYNIIKMFTKCCYSSLIKHKLNKTTINFKPALKIRQSVIKSGNTTIKNLLLKIKCKSTCLHLNQKNESGFQNNNSVKTMGKYVIKRRLPKLLNLFTLIQFPNEACVTINGTGGMCYHSSQCEKFGGRADGLCAYGYGVCCSIEKSCGGSTIVNGTYFTGPNSATEQSSGIYACIFHIYKIQPIVRQLYIYLEYFEFASPINGNCVIDRFVVTGQNSNNVIPSICGNNSGQHLYVDVSSASGPIVLTVLSSGAQGLPKFRIRIFQLKEGDQLLAPYNCLQYYSSKEGVIKSFNYQITGNNLNSTYNYMNNLNYVICIKKEDKYCSISYSNIDANGEEYPFELINIDENGMMTVPVGQAGVETYNCPDDYIIISGSRLCGYKLNDASTNPDFFMNYQVTDMTNGPFILNVHTDSSISGRGFRLVYKQNCCK